MCSLKAAGARVITIYHAERQVVFPSQLEGESSEFIEQQLMTREDVRVQWTRAGPASSSAPSSSRPDSPDSMRANDGSNDSSQGQDDIPRAAAPVIDLTQDVPRTVAARGRHRSRSRGAKGKGKVGVDKVKETLEELGYIYCSVHHGVHIVQDPPDMTEAQLEALRRTAVPRGQDG